MRLAGGVADHRLARGEHRGHDGVLGGHHARLVEEDVRAAQAGRAQLVAAADVDLGAELGERVDVRVEPPAADHVAAGGGTLARPKRASSGPASRNEARIRGASSGSSSCEADVGRVDADLVRPGPLDVGADVREQRDHRLDVADARHVREHDRLARRAGTRRGSGSAPFLFPAARTRPPQRLPALDHEGLGDGIRDGGLGHERRLSYPRRGADPRAGLGDADPLHEERGAAAPCARGRGVDRAYAQRFGEDEELWRSTALLHDFDYEMHPTLDKHPQDGAPILREEGYPEEVVDGVLSHAEHLGLPRDTPLKKTLFACDELAGFIHACGLVRPDGLETLEPKSVKKKLKQPSFAAGVHRDEVYEGAEELGVELDEHIALRGRGAAADRRRARARRTPRRRAPS